MLRKNITYIIVALIATISLSACNGEPAVSCIDESESIDYNTNEINEETSEEIEDKIEEYTVNIKMVGDCLIHDNIYKSAYNNDDGYNFDMLFCNVKDDIEAADLAIINQETIFTYDRNNYSGYPMFGSPVEVGDAEVNAGFDIIAHATNHTVDKNIQGIEDTLDFWRTKYPDIGVIGIHNSPDESDILYRDVNNIKLAFVNYTYGLNGLEGRISNQKYYVDMLTDDDIEDTINEASNNSDAVVAILHVGTEYVYTPTQYEVEQVDRFIDAGADVVICSHPHVVEPYEYRTTANGNSGYVFYSLGNFTSSQADVDTMLGGMADVTIKKTVNNDVETVEVVDFNMIPLITHRNGKTFTTYKLEDYTDDLWKEHRLYGKDGYYTKEDLMNLYKSIVNGQ